MVVIAIIAGVLAIGAPRLFSTSAQMRTSVRKLAISTREIRNVARLYNSTQRIVIQADDNEGHSYWVESAPGDVTLLSQEQQEELDRLTEIAKDEKSSQPKFAPDTRVVKRAVSLPRGLYFGGVEFTNRDRNIESGKAYIHFFPQGLADKAAIHITDRKNLNWTVTIHPLTGRADVYERKVSLEELRN